MVPSPGAGVPKPRYTCRTQAGTTVVPISAPDNGQMPGFSLTARRSDLTFLVQTEDGLRFRIGTGMSDGQRRNPPAVGTIITFTYHGKTRRGVPRFASFLRVREGY